MRTLLALTTVALAACGGIEEQIDATDSAISIIAPSWMPRSQTLWAGDQVLTHLAYWDSSEFNFPLLRPLDPALRQRWYVEADGTIRNSGSGRCLEIIYGSTSEFAYASLYNCHGWANQQWDRVPRGRTQFEAVFGIEVNEFLLINRNSHMCLTRGLQQVNCGAWYGAQLFWRLGS